MTAIRKTSLQVAYFQGFTNLTTVLWTSNDRFMLKKLQFVKHCRRWKRLRSITVGRNDLRSKTQFAASTLKECPDWLNMGDSF